MTDKQSERTVPRAAEATTPAQPTAPERIVVTESEDTRRSRALADAQAEAVKLRMDETTPGGRFMVNGVLVDANGKPVKED